MIKRIKTFIVSLIRHIYRGSPKASQKIIDQRFTICFGCDKYDNSLAQCKECGCNINKERILLNKLAWADQKCPLDKWNSV